MCVDGGPTVPWEEPICSVIPDPLPTVTFHMHHTVWDNLTAIIMVYLIPEIMQSTTANTRIPHMLSVMRFPLVVGLWSTCQPYR